MNLFGKSTIAAVLVPVSMVANANVANPKFDIPDSSFTGPTYAASISGGGGGNSSADQWYLYNNANTTTSTELLTSTDPIGQGTMIHLTTGAADCGLYQVFPTLNGTFTSFKVDVKVNRGGLMFATYTNGGTVRTSEVHSNASLLGSWQTLTLTFSGNTDELVLYSNSNNGLDAYIDNLQVVPEPATLSLVGIGLVGLFGRRKRS